MNILLNFIVKILVLIKWSYEPPQLNSKPSEIGIIHLLWPT